MILIKKWWVRLIVSLVSGGMISEAGILFTDGQVYLNALMLASILFIILSLLFGAIMSKRFHD